MAIVLPYQGIQPRLGSDVYLADNAAVIGDVELGPEVSIWFGAVLRGDVGAIRIGARSNVQDNATVHMTYQTSSALIGSDVIIAHNAVIHGAIIDDGALVGMGAVVMDNARIGAGAWVAAGSVVPPGKEVPPGHLYVGGEVKRPVSEAESGWARGAIERYVGLARAYRQG
jgi:gamma-carbonic anhydrase